MQKQKGTSKNRMMVMENKNNRSRINHQNKEGLHSMPPPRKSKGQQSFDKFKRIRDGNYSDSDSSTSTHSSLEQFEMTT